MKHLFTLIFFVSHISISALALDHIILRNGEEYAVKLYQITDEMVTFSLNFEKHVTLESIPTKDVYMVNIEKQGNVYLTSDGKRITGEPNRVDPKKNDVIYLVNGGELGARNIKITEEAIAYTPIKKSSLITSIIGTSKKEDILFIPSQEVFMIRYKSGMIDVITQIEKIEPEAQIKEEEPKIPQYKVLFHAVTKGQNLMTIAEEYNVTVKQIIEWNDLPAKSKSEAPLTVGMQLMIYQPLMDKK